jgi:hypothetical protein
MARLGVETYAGYTRCQHCGIYDSDPRWCDLCGMRKERQGPVNRKGRGTTAGFESRGEALVDGAAGGNHWRSRKTCPGIGNYWKPL